MPKLEIGGGNIPTPGYIQFDKAGYPWIDVMGSLGDESMPFPDDYFDDILAIHVLEHIERGRLSLALHSLLRILKRGGTLRIHVPNMMSTFKTYIAEPSPVKRFNLYQVVYGGDARQEDRHRLLFDEETLVMVLRDNGFEIVEHGVANDSHTAFWKERGIPDLSIYCVGRKA